jgi:predicted Zn finger-like uncharacterized protein
MFTVCPKCALTLVVTAGDLRIAQGYVRCGRCSSVFNALARLSDERQLTAATAENVAASPAAPESAAPAAPAPAAAPAATAPEPRAAPVAPAPAATSPRRPLTSDDAEAIPDAALEFNASKTDVMAVFVESVPNPEFAAATGSFKALLAANQQEPAPPADDRGGPVDVEIDAAFLAAMLKSENAAAAEPAARPPVAPKGTPAPKPAVASAPTKAGDSLPAASAPLGPVPAKPVPRHATPHVRPAVGAATAPAPAQSRPSEPAPRAQLVASEPDFDDAADTVVRVDTAAPEGLTRFAPHAWRAGVALGALLLLMQILNHYRDDLAANPSFTQPLTRLYAALGVHLIPHWDLHAYDVRQQGAQIQGAGGVMTVRASIKNATQQAQPLPLLRVTMQDRFGNRIAARDVPPRFYLPQTVPASSFLSAGQRIDAEMSFVDPGANAEGFEIDACLPASGGGVACANDPGAR